jgi:hypothetical protein
VTVLGNGRFTLMANPFNDGNGNYLTNVLNGSLPKQSQVLVWDGSGFATILKGGTPANWPAGNTNQLPPGMGFFVRNGAPGGGVVDLTNTFVGSIIVNNGGSVTNVLTPGFTLNGSPIPYGGNIAISGQNGGDTNMDFGGPVGKQSQILTWDPVGQGYLTTLKGGTPPLWGGTVNVKVGEGFFVNSKNAPTTNVVETLNVQ